MHRRNVAKPPMLGPAASMILSLPSHGPAVFRADRAAALLRLVVVAILLSMSSSIDHAQADDPLRVQTVTEWTGTISVIGSGGGEVPGLRWTVDESINADVSLTPDTGFGEPILIWIGSEGLSGSVNNVFISPCDQGSVRSFSTSTYRGSGALAGQAFVAVDVSEPNRPRYSVSVGGLLPVTLTIDSCDGDTTTNSLPEYPVAPRPVFDFTMQPPLPDTGFVLSGIVAWELQGFPGTDSDWRISWNLTGYQDCHIDIPTFLGQGEATWGKDIYDHDVSLTIAGKGCALTSMTMAMIAAGFAGNPLGLPPTPDGVNSFMTQKNGDFNGANVVWDAAVRDLSLGVLKYEELRGGSKNTIDHPGAARKQLNDALCGEDPHPVIIGVKLAPDKKGNQVPGHFVLATGKSGNTYTIADPATGTERLLTAYGNQFATRGIVKDPPGDISQLDAAVDDHAIVTIIDSLGNITGADHVGRLQQQIPNSAAFADRLDDDVTGDIGTAIGYSVQLRLPPPSTYRIVVTGLSDGPYRLTVRGFNKDGSEQPAITVDETARIGSVNTYRLEFDPNDRSSLVAVGGNLELIASVNQSTFATGQTLTATAGVINPGLSGEADFYVGVLRPDGSIEFFTGTSSVVGNVNDPGSFRPIATGVSLATPFWVTVPNFYSHEWTGSEPRGTWVLFVAALKPGALAGGSLASDAILGIAPATFSFP